MAVSRTEDAGGIKTENGLEGIESFAAREPLKDQERDKDGGGPGRD
jgi:hypothetical protein